MLSTIQKPRFMVDQMLGRLAKWLRLIGFDTRYYHTTDHARLLRVAREENRVLLTRNTQLLKTRPVIRNQISAVLIQQDRLDGQLRQLIEEFGLDKTAFHQVLCPRCNLPMDKLSSKEARGHVPSYVHKTHDHFAFCPQCKNYYWRGTHWENIREKMKDIMNSDN